MQTQENVKIKPLTVRGLTFGEGRPKICIPLVGENEDEIMAQTLLIRDNPCDLIEFRADWFEGVFDPVRHHKLLLSLRQTLPEYPLLYTFRTKQEGGNREISFDRYRHLLIQVSQGHYADLIDAEGFFQEEAGNREENADIKDLIRKIKECGLKVIASSHDFDKTDETPVLVSRMRKLQSLEPDMVKLAVMPKDKEDVRKLLEATYIMRRDYAQVPLVTMSMSDPGRISRVCGEWTGSCMTFASAGRASAPGQISAVELAHLLRFFQAD